MDIDEKKNIELSFREVYHIIHALPKLINHLKLQDISYGEKKYETEIEDMKKLKEKLEKEFDFKSD